MNPLLETLMVLDTLRYYGACTASTLETMGKISSATLKRYIKDLRNMGADIVSVKRSGVPAYECRNMDDLKNRLAMWIELEQERNLVAGSNSKFGHVRL